MDIRHVSKSVSVSPQICSQDVEQIKALGFRSIICNRPDGEAEEQPGFEELCEKASSLGLKCEYMPVKPGKITETHVAQFSNLLNELPLPTLAYCRTGNRCITLWAMANVSNIPSEDILKQAKDAGYDLQNVL